MLRLGFRRRHHILGSRGALGGLAHRRRDLIERRRSLLQAGGLLFGAPRQVIGCLADFPGAGAQRAGVGDDRADDAAQLGHRRIEVRPQPFVFGCEGFGHVAGQVTSRQPAKTVRQALDHDGLLIGDDLAFLLGARTVLVGRLPVRLGLGLKAVLLDPGLLEHLHGARHCADLVLALGARHLGGKVACCQAPHQRGEAHQRLGHPGADSEETTDHDHRQPADDDHVCQVNGLPGGGGECVALGLDGTVPCVGYNSEFRRQGCETRGTCFKVQGLRCSNRDTARRGGPGLD